MRILMTADAYLPRLGGGEYHVYYLSRGLRRLGHQVDLLVTEDVCPPQDRHDDEVHVVRVPLRGWSSYVTLLAYLWKLSREVDLLHSHYSYRLAALAAVIAWVRRKPFVVTQHGLGLLPPSGGPRWQFWVFRLWRFVSMRRSSRVISTSHELGSVVASLGFGAKTVHIPNGYDSERFRVSEKPPERPPGAGPQLLTVRRLVPKTGIQYLIQALPELRALHPGLTLVCVGEGRFREHLELLAGDLDVQDAVEFVGSVSHLDLPRYYERADVVVLPSSAESTSLTCIEALASGTPVVASRVGGLVELLGADEERGFLVGLFDRDSSSYDAPMRLAAQRINELATVVSKALTQKTLAREKATRAAAYVPTEHGWDRIVERTVSRVYEPLLS